MANNSGGGFGDAFGGAGDAFGGDVTEGGFGADVDDNDVSFGGGNGGGGLDFTDPTAGTQYGSGSLSDLVSSWSGFAEGDTSAQQGLAALQQQTVAAQKQQPIDRTTVMQAGIPVEEKSINTTDYRQPDSNLGRSIAELAVPKAGSYLGGLFGTTVGSALGPLGALVGGYFGRKFGKQFGSELAYGSTYDPSAPANRQREAEFEATQMGRAQHPAQGIAAIDQTAQIAQATAPVAGQLNPAVLSRFLN